MKNHITNDKLSELLEKFNAEYPSGDSFELARFMYNHGWESGMSSTCSQF